LKKKGGMAKTSVIIHLNRITVKKKKKKVKSKNTEWKCMAYSIWGRIIGIMIKGGLPLLRVSE
jgi:hypothetical protein